MVPQLRQGFLQPQASLARGKPQRLHVGGTGGSAVPTFPRSLLSKSICSGEKRIRQSLDADRGVRPVAAMHDGRVRQ
jgi:hypothetical protein